MFEVVSIIHSYWMRYSKYVCVSVLASDVNTLVRILTNRNNAQRQSIAESYHNLTQKVTVTTCLKHYVDLSA